MLTLNKPLALVVDDENRSLERNLDLLEDEGFICVGATSKKQAEREMKSSPAFDLLILDICLDPNNNADRSGFLFAREIKKLYPDLPIIGYSGKFSRGRFPKEYDDIFAEIHEKGRSSITLIQRNLKQWRDRAVTYHKMRINRKSDELDRLKRKYNFSDHDYNILREFIPGILQITDLQVDDSVEDILRNAGYELKIIDENQSFENSVKNIIPIPIWIQNLGTDFIGQVYGYPELYSHGQTKDKTIKRLLSLMQGYYNELMIDQDDVSPVVEDMKEYLITVFG